MVGSYYSKKGTPVRASVSVPVTLDGRTLLATGTEVFGEVKRVRRVGLGLVHETAALELEFTHLSLPDGAIPIAARLIEIDNARERVGKRGRIHGTRTTSSMAYRGSRYLTGLVLLGSPAPAIKWVTRSIVAHVTDPEIHIPAGADLTLELTEPLELEEVPQTEKATRLIPVERQELVGLSRGLPQRTYTAGRNGAESDLMNLLVVGSAEQVGSAFAAAGWEGADPISRRSTWKSIRAVASGEGYAQAPMSPHVWRDAAPDMMWQKGLNTLVKRHHLRLWKTPESWNGESVWIGAGTRDIGIRFFRGGYGVTHRVEEDIDLERSKIVNDLTLSGCVATSDWLERNGGRSESEHPLGDRIVTDGRIAVIRLQPCLPPSSSGEQVERPPQGNRFYRLIRRQILITRNDLIRGNIYWKSYEGARWFTRLVRRRQVETGEWPKETVAGAQHSGDAASGR